MTFKRQWVTWIGLLLMVINPINFIFCLPSNPINNWAPRLFAIGAIAIRGMLTNLGFGDDTGPTNKASPESMWTLLVTPPWPHYPRSSPSLINVGPQLVVKAGPQTSSSHVPRPCEREWFTDPHVPLKLAPPRKFRLVLNY